MVMVLNDTISVISWRSVLLLEETRVPEKTTDLSKSLTNIINNVVSSTHRLSEIGTHNVSDDKH